MVNAVGGCLESLQHLRGTPYWPDLGQWEEAILFFETSEEKPTPSTVDGILMDYENMGVLERIRGLLVGRPYAYTPEERRELREVVLERTRRYGFPVVADMDFGHTSPMFMLPRGGGGRSSARRERFEIAGAAVNWPLRTPSPKPRGPPRRRPFKRPKTPGPRWGPPGAPASPAPPPAGAP